MPNSPAYSAVDGVPVNYVPGDWPETAANRDANETAFTDGEGQQLSSAVQVPEADQAALELSGDERLYPEEIVAVAVAAPSALTPDIAGKQASQTPYVNYHLFP
jgi:hypothetical protein